MTSVASIGIEHSVQDEQAVEDMSPLRRARKALGLTQKELARRTLLCREQIHRLEHGKCQPQGATRIVLAAALYTTPATLFPPTNNDAPRVNRSGAPPNQERHTNPCPPPSSIPTAAAASKILSGAARPRLGAAQHHGHGERPRGHAEADQSALLLRTSSFNWEKRAKTSRDHDHKTAYSHRGREKTVVTGAARSDHRDHTRAARAAVAAGTRGRSTMTADTATLEQLVQALHDELANLRATHHQPRLLTANQVAEQLGVAPSKIQADARAGRIETVRLGKYLRFRPEAVDGYLSAHTYRGDKRIR